MEKETNNSDSKKELFTVKEGSCVGFDSQWKVKKVTLHSSAQTNVQSYAEIETNTAISHPIETQTEEPEIAKTPEYDEERLAAFLKRLYPKLSQELNDAATSQVFKNYHGKESIKGDKCKLLSSLKLSENSGDYSFSVSSLSWNCTGNKIAVATVQEHDSWCNHNGRVQVHTFIGGKVVNENVVKIKASNCVTTLKFHPTLPPILVAGTYTGNIVIWNTQSNENETTLVKVVGHDEIVTQVSWIFDLDDSKTVLLASSSLDGTLSLWDFGLHNNELKLKEKYKIKAPMFGRLQRKSELPKNVADKVERGIVAFDFSQFTPEMFVVAGEGGLVAQCSRLGCRELNESSKDCKVFDPVFKYYRSHEGEITSIFLSPERQDLFVTNGTEGEIHFFTFGEEEPGRIVCTQSPILYATWVPYSQNMIMACGSKGSIQFYDSRSGKLLKQMQGADETTLQCAEFHRSRISVVAFGAKDGSLQFWDIPWNSF